MNAFSNPNFMDKNFKWRTTIDHKEIATFNAKYKENAIKMKEKDYEVLEMLYKFAISGNAKTALSGKNGTTAFYLLSWKLIQQQFPNWDIGRTSCFNRIKRLVQLGFMKRHPEGKTYQGYYKFTTKIDQFPTLKGQKSNIDKFMQRFGDEKKELQDANVELLKLKNRVKSLEKTIRNKDQQIKELYEVIEFQKRLIKGSPEEKPKTQKATSQTPRQATDKVPPSEYQLCKKVYYEKRLEYSRQVKKTDISARELTINEERSLRDLVSIAKNDIKKFSPIVNEDPTALANEFGFLLDSYIKLASKGALWYGDSFTPSNLYRNYNDFIDQAEIFIKNGETQITSKATSQDRNQTELEQRLEELTGKNK